MLRRDRRRAQAAAAAALQVAATATVADIPENEVVASVDEGPASVDVTPVPASDTPVPVPTTPITAFVSPTVESDAPASSSFDRARAAWRSAARPRRTASAGSTGPAASPVAALSAQPTRTPRRSRTWKMTGAAVAIVTLVGGTALPAIAMVRGETSTVSTTASADIRAQSYTASADILPDVVVSGDFTATTPEELVKRQAISAATARSGISPIANPGQVIIPMAAGTYTMTNGFGAPRPGRTHMGQDYAAAIGTPIYAAADGVVTMSQSSFGGYGETVQIQHDNDGSVSTLYGHMNNGTRAVSVGEHVVAGQFLGRVGTTGYTIGSCLHFEVHINGVAINPVPWLQAHVS